MRGVRLKQLADELVSLNDENLARRVIETSDVQWCLSELQDMLTVDAVEVVRCKDCKWYAHDGDYDFCDNYTSLMDHVGDETFCSYGERRDDD
nr:MAG TPA: hypothetical protein [Caudoviricetes sp.]